MKKILSTFLAVTSLLILMDGCQKDVNPDKESNSDVSNNLSSSVGEDEVYGTYSDGNSRIVFDNGNATIYTTGSAASTSVFARSAIPSSPKLKYYYSYNSEAKTLELQLAGIWNTNSMAIDYKAQVQAAEEKCAQICTLIKQGIDENTEFQNFCRTLNMLKSDYGNTIMTLFKEKVDEYITNQQSLLKYYLQKKYNSVIKMTYSKNDNTLTLSQIFQNDLSDASSEFIFTSEDARLLLNGYADLKPFSVTIGSEEFVGIPVFDSSEETLSVDLYQYLGDVLSDDEDITTLANNNVNKWVNYILEKFNNLSNDEKTALMLEASSNKTDTIETWINDELASEKLTASYKIDSTGETPKLTITTIKDFSPRTGGVTVLSGSYDLTYVKVLSSSIDGVPLYSDQ